MAITGPTWAGSPACCRDQLSWFTQDSPGFSTESPGKLGQLVTLFPDKCQAQNFHLWETNKLDNWKVEIMTLGRSG